VTVLWLLTAKQDLTPLAVIEEEKKLVELVESLPEKYESGQPNPVTLEYPDRLLQHIIGFTIDVSRI